MRPRIQSTLVLSVAFLVHIALLVSAVDDLYELDEVDRFFAKHLSPKTTAKSVDLPRSPVYGTRKSGKTTLTVGKQVSLNRKFLAKSPSHDKHFEKILRQQDEATIRNPSQLVMIANDQAEMRNKLRNSLQTSDDDIYEVESAPEMRSTPYYRAEPPRAKYAHRPMPQLMMPVSLRVEPTEYEPPKHYGGYGRSRHGYRSYRKSYEEPDKPIALDITLAQADKQESYPEQYASNSPQASYYQADRHVRRPQHDRQYNPSSYPSQTVSASMNVERQPAYRHAPSVSAYHEQTIDHSQHQSRPNELYSAAPNHGQFPPQSIGASVHPSSDGHHEDSYESDGDTRAAVALLQPTMGMESQQILRKAPLEPSPGAQANQLDHQSAWLDMGAYSSGKGAFGWYSDVPVGL